LLDESDEKGMMDLLEAAASYPTTTAEQSLVAEEARIEPSERVDFGTQGASPASYY